MEIGLCHSRAILGSRHKYFIFLVLADRCRPGIGIDHRWYGLVRVAHRLDFLFTLWHSEQVKVSGLWTVTGVSALFIAGWWSGCSKSEFGMVIVAGSLQQLHDCRPCFRRYLSLWLRAVHSRCAVASHNPQGALLWLSQKPFRIFSNGSES